MRNVDIVKGTSWYGLHSGNHNEKGDPHKQYVLKSNCDYNNENNEITISNCKIKLGTVIVNAENGQGTLNFQLQNLKSPIPLFANVITVDDNPDYAWLYFANIWTDGVNVKITVRNWSSDAGTRIKISYGLLSEK